MKNLWYITNHSGYRTFLPVSSIFSKLFTKEQLSAKLGSLKFRKNNTANIILFI